MGMVRKFHKFASLILSISVLTVLLILFQNCGSSSSFEDSVINQGSLIQSDSEQSNRDLIQRSNSKITYIGTQAGRIFIIWKEYLGKLQD